MISVIVPTYNEEENIVKCMQHLRYQSILRKSYEIIIVDGHSTDRTIEKAKPVTPDRIITQTSKGVGGARNDGIAIAKGDIVVMTDADCYVPDDWLENIQNIFNKDPNTVCVYGPVKTTQYDNKLKYKFYLWASNTVAYISHVFGLVYWTVGANCAFRKKPFLEIGGYKEYSAGDDIEIGVRLRKKGKIMYSRKMYVYFSMRRYEMFGIIRTLYIWLCGVFKDVFGMNIGKKVDSYNRVDYTKVKK